MARSFTIQSGGAALHGETSGEGPCAILLHAGVADRRMWRETMPCLAKTHLTVAYDQRGFGKTRAPDETFRHIDDLGRIIAHFGCTSSILIGSSQGGRIAIDYTLEHPEKVAALVLLAPAITGAPAPGEYLPEIASLLANLEVAEENQDIEQANSIEAHLWLDGPLNAEGRMSGGLRRLFLEMNGLALRHVPLEQEQSCPSAVERLHSIAAPTLVIWGDLDFPHIQQRSQWLADVIPGAQSLVMKGCAHLPNFEQPERFNAALEAFLAGTKML